MRFKADEIASVIQREIEDFRGQIESNEVGRVLEVGDGIARVYGLAGAMAGEMVEFPSGVRGQVFNLEENSVGVIILGDYLKIAEGDAITDSAEAFNLIEQRGIKNVILMGVHTNMCVLGRPFGIRQMVYQGKNVVLMRDMTDSMFNPKQKPQVSHFRGTELVIEHIEKHWCPSVLSEELAK